MTIKILAMTVFLHLIYTASIYQPQYFAKLDQLYILLALILAAFIIIEHMGRGVPTEGVHGIFGNKNTAAWFIAAASIAVGYKLIIEKFNVYLFGAFLILLSMLWVIASRGALVAFSAGMLMAVFMTMRHRLKLIGLITLAALPIAFLLIGTNEFQQLLARADSSRLEIYENAFTQITLNLKTILFGYGLAGNAENTLASGLTMNNWHSIYINTMFYLGVIGLALFLYCFFYRFWLLVRNKTMFCVWDAVVFGIAVALMFDGNRVFNYPNGVYMSFVLPVFFANLSHNDLPS